MRVTNASEGTPVYRFDLVRVISCLSAIVLLCACGPRDNAAGTLRDYADASAPSSVSVYLGEKVPGQQTGFKNLFSTIPTASKLIFCRPANNQNCEDQLVQKCQAGQAEKYESVFFARTDKRAFFKYDTGYRLWNGRQMALIARNDAGDVVATNLVSFKSLGGNNSEGGGNGGCGPGGCPGGG